MSVTQFYRNESEDEDRVGSSSTIVSASSPRYAYRHMNQVSMSSTGTYSNSSNATTGSTVASLAGSGAGGGNKLSAKEQAAAEEAKAKLDRMVKVCVCVERRPLFSVIHPRSFLCRLHHVAPNRSGPLLELFFYRVRTKKPVQRKVHLFEFSSV